jgi:RES domain-containing protein
MIAWRITKTRHPPYDGTGAHDWGGRWNSRGRRVIYGADSFAGAILEILAHTLKPRTLPGPHHAVRIDVPDELLERLDPAGLPGWDARQSPAAAAFGDAWYDQRRSAGLLVPAVSSRPVGLNLMINPEHPDAARITVSEPFAVPWDERLF